MLHHVVMFSVKKAEDLDAVFQGLKLLEQIPESETLQICRNVKADQLSDDVDVVVFGRFQSEAQLAAYKAHPLYAESIKRVRPLRDARVVADFWVSE